MAYGKGGAYNVEAQRAFREKVRSGKALEKLRDVHILMIEEIIINPAITHQQLAEKFGYSRVWVTLVLGSDLFRSEYKKRREAIMNPIITATIQDKVKAATSLSWDKMLEKLTDDSKQVPDATLIKILEIGTKALFGDNLEPQKKPAMTEDHLDKLAERLISLQSKISLPNKLINEVTCEEIQDATFRAVPETCSNVEVSGSESDAGQSAEGAV